MVHALKPGVGDGKQLSIVHALKPGVGDGR